MEYEGDWKPEIPLEAFLELTEFQIEGKVY